MEFDCLGEWWNLIVWVNRTLKATKVACMTFQRLVQKSSSESSDSLYSVTCMYAVVCALIGQLEHGTICQLSWGVIGSEDYKEQ